MEICRNNLKHPRGVTLLELTVGMGIMVLMAMLVVPSFSLLRRNVALGNASRELQSALRLAQNRAFVAQDGANHSIRLETDHYVIFGGSQTATINLPSGIVVSGTAGQTITFNRLTGLPQVAQEVVLAAGPSQQTVSVSAGGLISLP